MPSRMKDEVFLYFVYGTSCLMKSHVASSMRKVTTRDFAFTRCPRFGEAVTRTACNIFMGLGTMAGP
jgi:hypothetical protein